MSRSRRADANLGREDATVVTNELSLPKGGGALRGLNERFSVAGSTGAAHLEVPIAASPGRNGMAPNLALRYASGQGNGPFGLGWKLTLPSIRRKTSPTVPRYRGDDRASDVFSLSGEGSLTPFLESRSAQLDQRLENGFVITRYRPQNEARFTRIERWEPPGGQAHWRTVTRDNRTSVFGKDAESRVSDPSDPGRVFQWLLCESFDDRGNLILYRYKSEDGQGIDEALPHERNRPARGLFAARYLKRVWYGNRRPGVPGDWLFEIVFDYGEHDSARPEPRETKPWSCRPDPFSTCRAGFEIRRYRLCRRILVFHRFEELGPRPALVQSTDFKYEENPSATHLTRIHRSGYAEDPETGRLKRKTLPALELGYSQPQQRDPPRVRTLDAEKRGLPHSIDPRRHRWVDLDGEGLSGLLSDDGGAWSYRRNLGEGLLGPAQLVGAQPSMTSGPNCGPALLDLTGDGRRQLVVRSQTGLGYYQRTEEGGWTPFTPLPKQPAMDWDDPNLRFVDLTGDGRPDLLVAKERVFVWYASEGKHGYAAPEEVQKAFDEEKGPSLVFADPDQSIFTADMNGDGLVDLVRIRNGEVCYWPSLGRGRFGAKVSMSRPPRFDSGELFDSARLLLADLDGTGTNDLIYHSGRRIDVYFNQSGNRFSRPTRLQHLPGLDKTSSVWAADLIGCGAASIVWTSSASSVSGASFRFVDFVEGRKPHLLTSIRNRQGGEIDIEYAPSTRFYVEDRDRGRPWRTRLPFPVQVVARVKKRDVFNGASLVTAYRYSDGLFDSKEREFRGFGLVERVDAEAPSSRDEKAGAPSQELLPVLTRNWFHTGAAPKERGSGNLFPEDYYGGDPAAPAIPEAIAPSGLSAAEEAAAYTALCGKPLREEIYCRDGTPHQAHPYRVTQNVYRIRRLQGTRNGAPGSFYAFAAEEMVRHYERRPRDPRVEHRLILSKDDFGNTLLSARCGYPRRRSEFDEQKAVLIRIEQDRFSNSDGARSRRIGVPVESAAFELTGARPSSRERFTVEELRGCWESAEPVPHGVESGPGLRKRLLERKRTVYWNDGLSAPGPLGETGPRALVCEERQQIFDSDLVRRVFDGRAADRILSREAALVKMDGGWWAASPRRLYKASGFYQPVGSVDPVNGAETRVEYDRYQLLQRSRCAPLGNRVRVWHDYRVLLPRLLEDANGNRQAVEFDELGRVTAEAEMGKPSPEPGCPGGDTLDDPTVRHQYHFAQWGGDRPVPAGVRSRRRLAHGDSKSGWTEERTYFDGGGREILKKSPAHGGAARWIGSGRVTYDNKGNPTRQFPPHFSSTSDYHEPEDNPPSPSPRLFYDPLCRLVRVEHPDGTLERVDFDAWSRSRWDADDTVRESRWLKERMQLDADDPRRRAARLSLRHHSTPSVERLDPWGRVFCAEIDNGPLGKYRTRLQLDLSGRVLEVLDPRGIAHTRQVFDMAGNRLLWESADGGRRLVLNDAGGNPIRRWDSRGFASRAVYDALRRPTRLYVQPPDGIEFLAELNIYGESHPEADRLNLRGHPWRQYDQSGLLETEACDFKGNVTATSRRLTSDHRGRVDWSPVSQAEWSMLDEAARDLLSDESFRKTFEHDALSRPTRLAFPDGSEVLPAYHPSNKLAALSVLLPGEATPRPFLDAADYDAAGRRRRIAYSNGTVTEYEYCSASRRTVGQRTVRCRDGKTLLNLALTYDAAGNPVQVESRSERREFFGNRAVEPVSRFVYDAIGRLVRAEGRELAYLSAPGPLSRQQSKSQRRTPRRFERRYRYDEAGNLVEMSHRAGEEFWRTEHACGPGDNRLAATRLPGAEAWIESHSDAHGNLTRMEHLKELQWDFKDRLRSVDLGGGGRAYYFYDSRGRRTRKVIERGDQVAEEWIDLGGFTLLRRHSSKSSASTRRRLEILDDRSRIGVIETRGGRRPRVRFEVQDAQGSPRLETDGRGRVTACREYYPYGGVCYESSRRDSPCGRRRFCGKEQDRETGLCFFGARCYAPWMGRWLSVDPESLSRFADSQPETRGHPQPDEETQALWSAPPGRYPPASEGAVSTYLYSRGNPLRFIDPDGRDFVDVLEDIWNWALAPLIRLASNAALGALIGFLAGGPIGALVGGLLLAVPGGIHGWAMASAGTYDWGGWGWLEFLADNTWGLLNSVIGSLFASANIGWNPINRTESRGSGSLYFTNGWFGDYDTTLGNVTVGNVVPKHERVHALQARIFGPLYLPLSIAHYVINTVLPYWLIYHDYAASPITSFGEYFSRGVYPHTWQEEWAYSIEGSPP